MDRYKGNQELRDSLAKAKRMLRKQEALVEDIETWIQSMQKSDELLYTSSYSR